jgi:DNA-binding GntR family transcriptional regulator
MPPGMRLVETELARRFGFSRTPIRGALRVLLREGYVVTVDGARRRRLVVAPLSVADSAELFEIVGAIEGLGASAAAKLPERKRRRLATELRGFDEALLAAARREIRDPIEIFELFTRFHLRYMETAAGPRLRALHDATKPQAERYRRLYSMGYPEERVAASVAEHQVIVDAIENGDPTQARAAVERNWQNAAKRLARAIKAADGDGAAGPTVSTR